MELLERYLYAVSKHLPQARKEDLLAELRENLLAQIEDVEVTQGRPLTTDEVAEILRRHGRPLVVAARYLPQRHLIGPVMFPWFWYVLRLAVPIGMLVSLIAYVSQVLFSPDGHFAFSRLFSGLLSAAFNVAAAVTLIFAVAESILARYHEVVVKDAEWDPRELPRVDRDARGETPRWRDRKCAVNALAHRNPVPPISFAGAVPIVSGPALNSPDPDVAELVLGSSGVICRTDGNQVDSTLIAASA
jgi:hypothetical protein